MNVCSLPRGTSNSTHNRFRQANQASRCPASAKAAATLSHMSVCSLLRGTLNSTHSRSNACVRPSTTLHAGTRAMTAAACSPSASAHCLTSNESKSTLLRCDRRGGQGCSRPVISRRASACRARSRTASAPICPLIAAASVLLAVPATRWYARSTIASRLKRAPSPLSRCAVGCSWSSRTGPKPS